MENESYDVIVVGAGFGGCSCGGLLAKKGLKVLLVDKNARFGGKAMSLSKNGFTYSIWPVNSTPLQDNLILKVLEELGVESKVELLAPKNIFINYKNSKDEWKSRASGDPSSFGVNELFDLLEVKEEDMEETLRFFSDLTLMSPQEIETLSDISFGDWTSRYTLSKGITSYLSFFSNMAFLVPIERLCCAEGIRTFQTATLKGGNHFCKGGWGQAAEAMASAVEENSGRILLSTEVNQIVCEKNQITGIVTSNGKFEAPIVVSNVGIQPTVLHLVGEANFKDDYVDYVKNLEPGWGVIGNRYFLKKKITDQAFGIIFTVETGWTDELLKKASEGEMPEEVLALYEIPTNYDTDSTPEGKMIMMTSVISPCDPQMSEEETNRWLTKCEETVFQIFPDLPEHIESKESYTTKHVSNLTRKQVLPNQGGECIGLAQSVGQAGTAKPDIRSPIQGLFYVGCDAGGTGIGIHQAVDSGINVAEAVFQYARNQIRKE